MFLPTAAAAFTLRARHRVRLLRRWANDTLASLGEHTFVPPALGLSGPRSLLVQQLQDQQASSLEEDAKILHEIRRAQLESGGGRQGRSTRPGQWCGSTRNFQGVPPALPRSDKLAKFKR
jgi:hypothetical protein